MSDAPDGSLFDATNGESESLGLPGVPISRNAAFYRGFMTTLGALAAILFAFAVREAGSVLELILVAVFLAIGLNPIVELLIRRGWRRSWGVAAVAVVFLG